MSFGNAARGVLLVVLFFVVCLAPAAAAPWLFVTDIHLDPASHHRGPIHLGSDSNVALLDSAIAAMKRVDPHPPVVVIGGDELAHIFDWSRAGATFDFIARRFDAAFPDAQFVLTLGNEDSACGDYETAPHSTFLHDIARSWGPLVNRHGAAPGFATTFPRDGFYTARLPLAHVQAVVIDDVFWSPRYHSCTHDGDPGAATIAELRRALHASSDQHWILLHIPPGIDAYSTAHLVHRLVVVPFLDPLPRELFDGLIADPSAHVTLVLAAHTHKFAYRIAGTAERPVPMLLMPSISPIFGNAPGFLTAQADPDGTLSDIESYAFDGTDWQRMGGFPALGVSRFTGPALADLHKRLAHDDALRKRFEILYEGGGEPEIDERSWMTYWCSATAFSATAFRACDDQGGTSLLTQRGIKAVVVVVAIALVVAMIVAYAVYLRARRRNAGLR